jgi:hypothetical protein
MPFLSCQANMETRTHAWWNQEIKQVTCANCHSLHDQRVESPVKTRVLARQDSESLIRLAGRGLGAGRPGGSAQAQLERLRIEKEKRLETTWGRYLAPIVNRLSNDPQLTPAWANGARGEEWVGGNLERLLGNRAL